ncbi:TRAP transporter solute receptor, TAXI family protein [Natrialba chahannaoensis JCM 10990]|uniref:TRAP transporter solute receptor, TAXI family protein n=1 Tax=Natrialba chahannaoensis JCM 10990 TaxID=1227492 RepID=M0AVM4_9EURY|nr:TAXI family TRAP transporter solute-binding subunit [Natrialba chahannaoensis]ELZ02736.1 TRAP transporter solute receptor, TAXI family protein [Natrialba chahannaoensis JCM 10990]
MVRDLNRREFVVASGVAGITGLAGCLGDEDESQLSWHAGGESGTYYPLSGDFKSIVDEETEYSLQVQTTGASLENVGSLGSGDADFALIQNDIAHFAYNGTGIDQLEGNEITTLRGVATLYPETIHVITQAGSGIETIGDLDGQTINTGDAGSGTQVNALQILETAGIEEDDFTEQNTDFGTAADQIRDGDVDAAFVVGGWPVGSIQNLDSSEDISLVEIASETREDVMAEAEWFAEDTIPGGTYDGIGDDVETVSVQAMIATHADQDEEVVETVTETIFENLDQISRKEEFIDIESAQDGMPIDLHPGAAAYFE